MRSRRQHLEHRKNIIFLQKYYINVNTVYVYKTRQDMFILSWTYWWQFHNKIKLEVDYVFFTLSFNLSFDFFLWHQEKRRIRIRTCVMSYIIRAFVWIYPIRIYSLEDSKRILHNSHSALLQDCAVLSSAEGYRYRVDR